MEQIRFGYTLFFFLEGVYMRPEMKITGNKILFLQTKLFPLLFTLGEIKWSFWFWGGRNEAVYKKM